ncbi:glycosyltransferase family 2 protein [Vibrio breoganii]
MYKLSILIPTYNYAEGLKRIINEIPRSEVGKNIEVIIFDNSTDENVAEFVRGLDICVNYKRTKLVGNPCVNWNDLLSNAKGEYSMLLHHDEFLPNESSWNQLLEALSTGECVYLTNLILTDSSNTEFRHMPNFIRNRLIIKDPDYLIRRNFVGPCGCFIFKTSLKIRFDSRLIWLVDVDFYIRLLNKATNLVLIESVSVSSYQRKQGSITNSLASNVKKITNSEISLLKNEAVYANNRWIKPKLFTREIESFIWNTYRFIFKFMR